MDPSTSRRRSKESHPTILLVDGYTEDRQYWSSRLKASFPDSTVLEAKTGAAGLAMYQAQRVDCFVTELDLPDMSGFTILVNLVGSAKHPGAAVVMLSRVGLYHMKQIAMSNGAQAYLVKSVSSGDELGMAIHKALAAVGPTFKEPR